MINRELTEILRTLVQKLGNNDIRWVLVGSMSLALQGVKVVPGDIDILTDKNGAYKINALLKDFEVKSVKYRRTDNVQSYLGEFKVNNIKIEVMAEYQEKVNGQWQTLDSRLVSPTTIQFEGLQIPISDLGKQLQSYEISGREKDVDKIAAIREALENRHNQN